MRPITRDDKPMHPMRVLIAFFALQSTAFAAPADYASAVGNRYDDLRNQLAADGWMPIDRTEADDCFSNRGHPLCRIYPEASACAGTGVSPCRMIWTMDGKTLVVTTAGESNVTVTYVSLCRDYAVNFETETGSIITISPNGVLLANEGEDPVQLSCEGNACLYAGEIITISQEVPGAYAVINGRRWNAVCRY